MNLPDPLQGNLPQRLEQSAKVRVATAEAGIPEAQHPRISADSSRGESVSFRIADIRCQIDMLFERGLIDEVQHCYGQQLRTMYLLSRPPVTNQTLYDDEMRGIRTQDESDEETVWDQMQETLRRVPPPYRAILVHIVLDDKPMLNEQYKYLCFAFDALGFALQEMRGFYKKKDEE